MDYKLSSHPRIQLVIAYAKKKGVLKFSPQTNEKQEEDKENNINKREGYSSEDIEGFWMPDSILTYFQGNWNNFKEAYDEFGFRTVFRFLTLGLPWSGWVWVLNSTDHVRGEIVDDLILSKKHKHERNLIIQNYQSYVDRVSEKEITQYLNQNFTKVTDYLFVSPQDPSTFYYDPKNKPYALADGWSASQVGEILGEWLEKVGGVKLPTEYNEHPGWN